MSALAVQIQAQNYNRLSQPERAELRGRYIEQQEGKCCHCGGSLSDEPPEHISRKPINWRLFPRNFLKWPVHLHHSHKTGMTIGAVHARCNAVLWQYHGE